jgi:hypothetical protein
MTEMIGNAIAQRGWPEESFEWKGAAEARRTWEYRSNTLIPSDAWSVVGIDELINL